MFFTSCILSYVFNILSLGILLSREGLDMSQVCPKGWVGAMVGEGEKGRELRGEGGGGFLKKFLLVAFKVYFIFSLQTDFKVCFMI